MLFTRKKTFAVLKEGPTTSPRTLKNEGQKHTPAFSVQTFQEAFLYSQALGSKKINSPRSSYSKVARSIE